MSLARRVIELGHALRAQEKLKVRQPLAYVWVSNLEVPESMKGIILEELNVKEWGKPNTSFSPTIRNLVDEAGTAIAFETAMTDELKLEGLKREFVRQVNALRKKQGLTIQDTIKISYATESEILKSLFLSETESILRDTIAKKMEPGQGAETMSVNGEIVQISLKK